MGEADEDSDDLLNGYKAQTESEAETEADPLDAFMQDISRKIIPYFLVAAGVFRFIGGQVEQVTYFP